MFMICRFLFRRHAEFMIARKEEMSLRYALLPSHHQLDTFKEARAVTPSTAFIKTLYVILSSIRRTLFFAQVFSYFFAFLSSHTLTRTEDEVRARRSQRRVRLL